MLVVIKLSGKENEVSVWLLGTMVNGNITAVMMGILPRMEA